MTPRPRSARHWTRLTDLFRLLDFRRAGGRGPTRIGVERLEAREMPAAVLVRDVQHVSDPASAFIPFGSTSTTVPLARPVAVNRTLVTGSTSHPADWAGNSVARFELVDTNGSPATAEAVRVTRGTAGGNATSGRLDFAVDVTEFLSGVTVEHQQVTIGSAATSAAASLGTAWASGRSFVVLSQSAADDTPNADGRWAVRGTLTGGGSSLTVSRVETGAAVVVAAQVATVDADSGAAVQAGQVTLTGASASAGYATTPGAGDLLFFSSDAPAAATGVEAQYRVRGTAANGTVNFATLAAGGATVSYFVVSVPGAVVQTGEVSFAAATTDTGGSTSLYTQSATLASVDPARSSVWVTASGGDAARRDTLGDTSFKAVLDGSAAVVLTRADRADTPAVPTYGNGSAKESAATAAWAVVQWPTQLRAPTGTGGTCPPLMYATSPLTGTNGASGSTPKPVRYADGAITIGSTDLAADGAGGYFGLARSWTNARGYQTPGAFGTGWLQTSDPYLLDFGASASVVLSGTDAESFDLVGGAYAAAFYSQNKLAYDAGNGWFVYTDTAGTRLYFDDFTGGTAAEHGRLLRVVSPDGTEVEVTARTASGAVAEMVRSRTVGGVAVVESLLYDYVPSGVNAGLVASVTHRRQTGGGAWETVRTADYGYYGASEAGGPARHLKTATVADAAGGAIGTTYYRYYNGEAGGAAGLLKFVLNPAAFDQAVAALGSEAALFAASDAAVSPYADNYFEYDAAGRVTLETASSAGCSVCSGGQGTTTFAYATSPFAAGPNSWKTKTVVTNADGSVDTVYTNAAAQVMLKAHTEPGGGSPWLDYYRFDAAGRVILHANPSAVTGYDDTKADLVNVVAGNAQYLADSTGLIETTTYATSTTATATTVGDVAGYLKSTALRRGELGTDVPQEALAYVARTAAGLDTFHVAADTVYENDNGTGARTTTFAYAWYAGTHAPASVTTTLPAVSAAHNGSGAATTTTSVLDQWGRVVWSRDAGGFLAYTEYDAGTGAVVKTITDVDTTQTGTFANLPSGWATPAGGGLHLTTTYEVDDRGRVTKETTPAGRVTYTVYDDANLEVRVYRGWDASTGRPTGPTEVSREDRAGRYSESLTMSTAPNLTGGRPDGTEGIAAVQTLTRSYRNAAGQAVRTDAYFDLSGVAYSTAPYLGAANVNFYTTTQDYDKLGRPNRSASAAGTISRTEYDGLGRVVSRWIGTDDTPASGFWSPANLAGTNMVKVAGYEYDGGGVGDWNLTKATQIPGGGAADRVTQTWFDWRDRAVAVKAGVEGAEAAGVNRPLEYTDYDNLGQATKTRTYDADGVTPTVTGGVPQPLSSALLRAQSTTSYDEQGRAYRTDTFSVAPPTGAVSANSLRTEVWYDARGAAIKTADPNGLVRKAVFDGAGRLTTSYTTDGGGDTGYGDADDVAGDTVLTQSETAYDGDGLTLVSTVRERFHDASGTGALGSPSSGVGARVSYAGYYYDNAGRTTASVNVGTNGGAAWTRPGTVPGRSATALVTSYGYAADAVQTVRLTGAPTGGTFTLTFGGQATAAIAYNATAATVQAAVEALSSVGSGNAVVTAAPGGGWQVRFAGTLAGQWQAKMTANGAGLTGGTSPTVAVATLSAGGDAGGAFEATDPKAIPSRTYSDALGRTTQTVEAFTNGAVTDTSNKTVNYAYGPAGMTSLSAALTGGGVQTTEWVYGVTQAGGSAVDTNDVVGGTRYPDAATGAASATEQEAVTVNALGQTHTSTDRNGSVHTLTYDVLGRVVSDAVTTLGAGVDGTVWRIESAFDGQGNAYLVTSYDAASGGGVVNQVRRSFDGLGQLTDEWQARGGVVDTATSPRVQYGYSFNGSGSANQSRLATVTYPSGYAVFYNYAPGLDGDISRLSSLSDATGTLESYDYLGLGTVVRRAHSQPGVDLTYVKQGAEPTGDAGDQYTGLDRFGRVVDQRWLEASTGTAVDRFQYGYDENRNRTFRDNLTNLASGELYGYDTLNQLASFQRGTLNSTRTGLTGAATRSQTWDYDALGNWDGVTTNGSTETRTANAQNEITGIGGATTPTYDANGNMTGDETGRQFVYDAWNRLVAVKNTGGVVQKTYGYDGLNRRASETAGGVTTDLFYSDAWQVLEERAGETGTSTRYVWSPVYVNALVLRDRDTNADGTTDERLWVTQDANHNATALVSDSGTVVERFAYDPFGVQTVYDASYVVRAGGSGFDWTHGFQGMRYDSVSGLDEANERWYSPILGRWTAVDPIRFSGGDSNLYRFVNNSPSVYLDPTGLFVAFFGGFLGISLPGSNKLAKPGDPKYYPLYQGEWVTQYGWTQSGKAVKEIEKKVGKPGCQSEPIILIGHSLGGKTAITVAEELVKDKYRVDFLVTLDPVIDWQKQVKAKEVIEGVRPEGVVLMWNWYQDVDEQSTQKGKPWVLGASFPKADSNIKNAKGTVINPDTGMPIVVILPHTEIDDDKPIRDAIKKQIDKIIMN